ncbi:prepilin-type N-terminal cleavage/methylation domain-containing protein [Campylobacter fetus]|uniref:prepilin-type N-terminal cleavage/methylation domain-containing protein n=1 Tax=Campylobacter fetus TaxID=196 RepID=UPI000FCB7595|nr:prepilin-type N-terminal cleavage/methylation domain-containing protein [Campylobacter fetus]RUT49083.1 hypothetical protein BWK67_08525 [Campylobacter fetus]RUT49248.1 hypothetical protein BWK51_08500 [Campylobacter fetus]
MKKAFTLIEIIVVLVIIGIMASFTIPKLNRNDLRLAADQIVSDIRYTQHLAMIDDKFDRSDPSWYRGRWQIYFNTFGGQQTYTVFADQPNYSGNPDSKEIARNPINAYQHLTIGHSGISGIKPTKELNLDEKYGIKSINLDCGASNNSRIFFDELGRPYAGNQKDKTIANYNKLMLKKVCKITIMHSNGDCIFIKVTPITGFAYVEQPAKKADCK